MNLELGTELLSLMQTLKTTLKSWQTPILSGCFVFQIILLINVKVEKEKVQKGQCLAFYFISIEKNTLIPAWAAWACSPRKVWHLKPGNTFSRRYKGLKKMKTTLTILTVYYLTRCAKFHLWNNRMTIHRLISSI